MATIQIRIDESTKRSAKKVLDQLDIDMSSAIKVYLKQIAIHKGIPLKLTTENGLTPEEEKEIFRAAKEARANVNVSQPMSAKEAVEHLMHLS